MLEWARRLRSMGVIGLNERNLDYINPYNSRTLYPTVDDKLRTKLLARRYGIPTPELLGVIRGQSDIRRIEEMVADAEGFVIKPSRGSGGKGILVIHGIEDGRFLKGSGESLSRQRVVRYISNVLAGLYTLGGSPDIAVIETRVESVPDFESFSHGGVPDIRIVVFRGYPVMAMMRLSTDASDGKANLHQHAVGVGLDLVSGEPVQAVQTNRPIRIHPDTGKRLDALRVPDWTSLLVSAASCYEMTGLGYLGADLVIDRTHGPLLLELNARPGLSIQLANGCGLMPRFEHVHALERERECAESPLPSAEERVAGIQRALQDR